MLHLYFTHNTVYSLLECILVFHLSPSRASVKIPVPPKEGYELLLFCFSLLGTGFLPGHKTATSETEGINENMNSWLHAGST